MALSYTSISGGSSSSSEVTNDFAINIGTSGYTNISFSRTFPAGNYTCTSLLSDSTMDIYFIAEDGSNAAFAAASSGTTVVTASKSFNKAVIYGASSNDTLNFQFKYLYTPTSVTNNYLGVGPRVISIATSSLPNQNNTTIITGENFATDVEVTFTGTDAVARSAKSVTRSSATSLTVTRPDSMPPTYSPYTITVTNPGLSSPSSSNLHKLSSAVTAGSAPSWVTSTTLPTFYTDNSYSTTVSATDSDGGSTVTYSLVSGSLPSSMSFNASTATISGTSAARSNATFTVRATDSGGNYVDRQFTLPYQDVPVAPTIGTATDVGTSRSFNDGSASIAFTPVTTNTNITNYTVTSSPGGYTASGTSSPIVVTGLQSNTSYTFTVKANNSYGSSSNSSSSSSITATTIPQAPSITSSNGTGTSSTGYLYVNFNTISSGGKTVTYDATIDGTSTTVSGASSPLLFTGLTPNTSYNIKLRARNDNGSSAYSSNVSGLASRYTCPSGGTLSGSNCLTSSSYAATGSTTYNCSAYAGAAYRYCESSGVTGCCKISINRTTGKAYDIYVGAPVITTTYSCPSGGSLSGSTCTITGSYTATIA